MSAYEAFPSAAAAAAASSASSFHTAPAYPASAFPAQHTAQKPAAILQPDESAFDWLQRDAASPNAPAALKSLQGSRPLLSLLVGIGPAEPSMHIGDVCELFGRSGSGKTEMSYSAIAHNILPKVSRSREAANGPETGCELILLTRHCSLHVCLLSVRPS